VKKKTKKHLLGIGLDNADGHRRITKGENFLLLGGSKDTHEEMREKALKLNEALKKRRKNFDTVNFKELNDVAQSVGFKQVKLLSPDDDGVSPRKV
jgi:hypothetical protein